MEFREGDHVEFELSILGFQNQSRWRMNKDTGGSGNWAQGTVTDVDKNKIVVEFGIKDYIGTGHSIWPSLCHPDFKQDQWDYEGYLRLKHNLKCVCGSDKTYGKIGFHMWYCPKDKGGT